MVKLFRKKLKRPTIIKEVREFMLEDLVEENVYYVDLKDTVMDEPESEEKFIKEYFYLVLFSELYWIKTVLDDDILYSGMLDNAKELVTAQEIENKYGKIDQDELLDRLPEYFYLASIDNDNGPFWEVGKSFSKHLGKYDEISIILQIQNIIVSIYRRYSKLFKKIHEDYKLE